MVPAMICIEIMGVATGDPGFQDPNAAAAISSILDATRKDRGAEVWLGIGYGGRKSKVVVYWKSKPCFFYQKNGWSFLRKVVVF